MRYKAQYYLSLQILISPPLFYLTGFSNSVDESRNCILMRWWKSLREREKEEEQKSKGRGGWSLSTQVPVHSGHWVTPAYPWQESRAGHTDKCVQIRLQNQVSWSWAPALPFPGYESFGSLQVLSGPSFPAELIPFQWQKTWLPICYVVGVGDTLVNTMAKHSCIPDASNLRWEPS